MSSRSFFFLGLGLFAVLCAAFCSLPCLAQQPNVLAPHAGKAAAVDQEQFLPYWTTETGWRSELQLRNNLAAADLTVTPALRAPDGTETPLSPVTVKPQEVKIGAQWSSSLRIQHYRPLGMVPTRSGPC